jgi:hypothetical protein
LTPSYYICYLVKNKLINQKRIMKKNLFALGLMMFGAAIVAQTPRLVLYEEFTGETCPPCAATNPGLNTLLSSPTNTPKVVAIKWQVPIPSAPSSTWSLYQTNKTEIDWRWKSTGYGYNPAINSAPSSKIDGQEATVFGAASGHPANLTNGVITTAQSYTSAFSITMNRAWNFNCSAITLTVNITATAPFTSVGNLVFRCVMVERLIQFSVQPGTNGETKFENPAIKSFPTLQAGTPLAGTWANNQSMTFTLNCPLPSYVRKKDEVAFVGFIQDDGNRKVAQAVMCDKAALPTDGIASLAANVGITCNNSINPVITVNNTGNSAITAIGITPYINGVAQTPVNLTTNIPVSTQSDIAIGSITTPTAPGVYTFSYTINSTNSPLFNLTGNSSYVSFLVAGNYQGTPIVEGFPLGAFPPPGWMAPNADQGPSWSRTTLAGAYFQVPMHSAKYDFYNNGVVGDVDDLYLPPMDLSGNANPEMTFDYSYAQRTSASNDQLDVMVSDNCGATWTSVWSKSGLNLATTQDQTSSYIPDNVVKDFTQWRTEMVTLTGFAKSNVLVKFVATSDNGNNLYLDNVNLAQKDPVGIVKTNSSAFGVNVFPNPASGIANININSVKAGDVKITVVNAIGQVVLTKSTSVSEGGNNVVIDVKEFASGIYSVVVDSEKGSVTKKLTVTK